MMMQFLGQERIATAVAPHVDDKPGRAAVLDKAEQPITELSECPPDDCGSQRTVPRRSSRTNAKPIIQARTSGAAMWGAVSHSGVPSELGGRLVLAAADRGPSEGLTMVPSCPLAGDWLERDPDTTGMAALGGE